MSCSPQGNCWCAELPHGPMPDSITTENQGCLCRNCLEERLRGLELKRQGTAKV
jgi:hypothetical protein